MSYQVNLVPSGNGFTVEDDENVLSAGLAAGIQLPYSCRRGTCSTCRCRILSGKVDYGEYLEAMLPAEMKADGYALACQATPLSDLTLQIEELELKAQQPRVIPCRVLKIEQPVSDVLVVHLRLPQNEGFRHLAGQYIDFLLEDGVRRSYSIANKPSVHGVIDIELHLRHLPGGLFTDYAFSKLKPRALLRFEGPLGTFALREDSDLPIIFVASGTGFAPIKAMLEHAFSEGIERPMRLYWGGNRPADLYMNDLAERFAAEHSHFEYVPVISDATEADNWTGRTGFVHRAVMEDFADLSGHQIYACGNPLMVDAARDDFASDCRMQPDQFFADSFVNESDVAKAAAG